MATGQFYLLYLTGSITKEIGPLSLLSLSLIQIVLTKQIQIFWLSYLTNLSSDIPLYLYGNIPTNQAYGSFYTIYARDVFIMLTLRK